MKCLTDPHPGLTGVRVCTIISSVLIGMNKAIPGLDMDGISNKILTAVEINVIAQKAKKSVTRYELKEWIELHYQGAYQPGRYYGWL